LLFHLEKKRQAHLRWTLTKLIGGSQFFLNSATPEAPIHTVSAALFPV